ncbi:MAG TPA: threonine synthase [Thiobacillaceae bacterium]|nr:threonine synthase [Thiobacillaceae bacterium]HNU65314.1 threonine synthase [Thiobacillaceae bacterium]
MKYISTRGQAPKQSFLEILLGGLASDGGLYLPETYPRFSGEDLMAMRGMDYRQLAFAILSRLTDDIPAADLQVLIDKTYTRATYSHGRVDSDFSHITPVRRLEAGLYLLELSNGPTLAFKDMAMQLLGNLFEYALERAGQDINILGATSGDTGSAAEYAMRGKHNVRVFMLSPEQGMTPFQQAQMYSLQDANIFNIAVRGVFDDCQDIVKAASNDLAFKQKYRLGAVNSINWARVAAQVIYYFKAYFAVTRDNGEKVSFSVPSGNFGNVCAGHIARMMGLPIHQLIVATNENDVLDEFFRTGVYRPRRSVETLHTSSPSMDISKASNFERFIFDLTGRNGERVAELWRAVDQGGSFDLRHGGLFDQVSAFGLVSGKSTHADRLATIRACWERYATLIDTHTADGLKVGLEHRVPGIPLVCLETALPAKFEDSIVEALGRRPERPAGLEDLEALPRRVEVMDADVQAIKAYIARHAND